MSKSKPRTNPNPNPFAMPGMDLGNLMNFDIDKHLNGAGGDEDIDDDDLERELMELESNKPRKIERRAPPKPDKKLQDLNAINLDKLLNVNIEDDDADLDDVDDNELERELARLSPVEDEIRQVEQAPPAVERQKQSQNVKSTTDTSNDSKLNNLEKNLNSFSKKYNDAVNANDATKSKRFKRILDQYNDAIKSYKLGKEFDYEALPVAPEFIDSDAPSTVKKPQAPLPVTREHVETTRLTHSEPEVGRAPVIQPAVKQQIAVKPQIPESASESNDKEEREMFKGPEPAQTTLGALEQLQTEFKKRLQQAIETEDSSKKRRYDRNLKQVEAAIKAIKLNKPYEFAELVQLVPPGFNLPLLNGQPVTQANAGKRPAAASQPAANSQPQLPKPQQAAKATSPASNNPKFKQNDQNLKELKERQRLFKEAAIEAKQKGDDKVAILYLKNAKGFDNMIIAAQNGLPLDMTNLPKPPQMIEKLHDNNKRVSAGGASNDNDEKEYEIVSADDIQGDRDEIFKTLEHDLRNQIKIANTNSQYFTNLGDVANATKFRNIEKESLKDLAGLQSALRHGDPTPKYHYERRKYQIVNCCVDLTDNDCELTIIRCINLPIPSGMDAKSLQTYVKFEFPFPPETPQAEKTSKQSGNNPEYNQVYKLQIQRKQNKCLRLINRKELKIEVYYKAGLLKGDRLLATANVKLQTLEDKCEIHEAVELFEGRKPTTGKIEVKLRVRDPLLHKEIKVIEEKWLIIDKFLTSGNSKTGNTTSSTANNSNSSYSTIGQLVMNVDPRSVNYFDSEKEIYSIEILNFDRNLIEKQIETYKNRLSQAQLMELLEKSTHLNQLLESIKEKLKTGGRPAFNAYLNNISTLPKKYDDLAKQCQALDENKTMLHLKRKQIVENEIIKIKSRLN